MEGEGQQDLQRELSELHDKVEQALTIVDHLIETVGE